MNLSAKPVRHTTDQVELSIPLCPCCRQPLPDEDGDLERLIRNNIDRVPLSTIADAAKTSLSHVERIAKRVIRKRHR